MFDLRELITNERDRAWRLALRLTGDPQAAGDAVQEACVALLSRGAPDRVDSPRAWFLKAVVHTARNMQRGERRRRAREEKWAVDRERINNGSSDSPAGEAADRELAARVAEALGGLDDNLRLPLELVYQEGLTHAETAAVLNVERGAVGVYVQRGIERLRRVLGRPGTTLAPALVVAGIKAVELPAPPTAFAAAIDGILAGAVAGKTAVATTTSAAAGSVALVWKLLAGISIAGLLSVGGLAGWHAWGPRAAAPVPTREPAQPGTRKTVSAVLELTPRGSDARPFFDLLRRRGLRPAILGGAWHRMVIPPELRGRRMPAREFVKRTAKFNGLETVWTGDKTAFVLQRGVADARLAAVRKLFASKKESDRADAAWQCGYLHDVRVLPLLLAAAGDESKEVRREALLRLRGLGWDAALILHEQQAWPLLAAELQNAKNTESVRADAARSLGSSGKDRALHPLRAALESESNWVRGSAVRWLGHIRNERSLKVLREALEDRDPNIRGKALLALGDFGGEVALRITGRVARDENSGMGPSVIPDALGALGALGTPEAVTLLRRLAADPRHEVRDKALRNLAVLGCPGIEKLVEKDLDRARPGHFSALGTAGSTRALELLKQRVASGRSKYARAWAARALGEAPGNEPARLLEKLLGDPEPEVRIAAAEALCKTRVDLVVRRLKTARAEGKTLGLLPARLADSLSNLRGEAAARLLAVLLDCTSPSTRESALRRLHRPGATELLKVIEPLLLAKHGLAAPAAAEAAEAVVRIGGPQARGLLEKALDASTGCTRARFAAELMRMRSAKGLQAARQILAGDAEGADIVAGKLGGWGYRGPARFELIALAQKSRKRWVRSNALNGLEKSDADRALPILRQGLAHKDKYFRANAVSRIGRVCGKKGLPLLRAALKDEAPEVRRDAAGAAAEVGGKEGMALLRKFLEDRDRSVRRRAVSALAGRGDGPCRPLLRFALKDGDKVVRSAAAQALCYGASEESFRFAREAMKSPDAAVRAGAIDGLGRVPREKVWPILQLAVVDGDRLVRHRAISAIARMRGAEAVRLLARLAADPEEQVARGAIHGLEQLRDDRVLPVFLKIMSDRRPSIRQRAVECTRSYGGEGARAVLKKALADTELSVRLAAARLIGDLDDPGVLKIFKAALELEDRRLRRNAVLGLAQMRGAALKPLLVKASTDADPYIRADAVGALASTGRRADPEVSAILVKALVDRNNYVRSKACSGLAWTGSRYASLRKSNRDALLKHYRAESDKRVRGRIKDVLTMFYAGDPVVARALRNGTAAPKRKPEVF